MSKRRTVIVFWWGVSAIFACILCVNFVLHLTLQQTSWKLNHVHDQMHQATYFGWDRKHKPFVAYVHHMMQQSAQSYRLLKIKLHYHLATDRLLKIFSDQGSYNQTQNVLTLQNNVLIKESQGHEVHTSLAYISFNDRFVESQNLTRGYGPMGKFIADNGFKLTKNEIKLKNKVVLTLKTFRDREKQ